MYHVDPDDNFCITSVCGIIADLKMAPYGYPISLWSQAWFQVCPELVERRTHAG